MGLFNPFTIETMSGAINVLPNRYGRLAELGLFKFKGQTTKGVHLELKDGVLTLVSTAPWGGVPSPHKSGTRRALPFEIPCTPKEASVLAADVSGVRQFGSDQAETVVMKVNEKLQEMRDDVDQTMEYRQMGALKGLVLDADGTTVIEDYYDRFGITQKAVDFAFSNASTDVGIKSRDVVRHVEANLRNERMLHARALVSPEYFDALVSHKSVKEAFLNYAEAANRIGGDMRKGFPFGGIIFEEYGGQVDGKRFITAGEGYVFPIGTVNTFIDYGAPADFIESVNTPAMPFYAKQERMKYDRGIDILVQSNRLPITQNPGCVVKIKAT